MTVLATAAETQQVPAISTVEEVQQGEKEQPDTQENYTAE